MAIFPGDALQVALGFNQVQAAHIMRFTLGWQEETLDLFHGSSALMLTHDGVFRAFQRMLVWGVDCAQRTLSAAHILSSQSNSCTTGGPNMGTQK